MQDTTTTARTVSIQSPTTIITRLNFGSSVTSKGGGVDTKTEGVVLGEGDLSYLVGRVRVCTLITSQNKC